MSKNITFFQMLGAFVVFFVSFLFPPIIYLFIISRTEHFVDISSSFIVKSQTLVILSFTVGVLLYLLLLGKESAKEIFGKLEPKLFLKGIVIGLLVVIPIFLIKEGLFLLLHHFFGVEREAEQLIVQKFKDLLIQKEFFLVTLLSLGISIFGPLIEEILFRGFLQKWLNFKGLKVGAIWICALIFTLFHFESNLGIANIELLFPLLCMGLLLSYFREKSASLLFPIGMHIAFNTLGVVMLLTFGDSVLGH